MEKLQWVYNHVDPDLVTTVLVCVGICVFLYALMFHSEHNSKRLHMFVAFVMLVAGGYITTDLKWYNSFQTFDRRAGITKMVIIKSELYMVSETPANVITLTKVEVYNDEYFKKFIDTYGCVGEANDLFLEVMPERQRESLDCSTPKQ